MTDEQSQEIKEAFELFDIEKTGRLDYHELKVAMKALGFPVKKAEVNKLITSYDKSNTRSVDYEEFEDISIIICFYLYSENENSK